MKQAIILFTIFLACLGDEYHKHFHVDKSTLPDEDIAHWKGKGKAEINVAKSVYQNIIETKAKNIIIFVGDGMSLPTLTATRIYKAQKASNFDGTVMGEESSLFFETFPHVGLSKTYCVDEQTPDSASTASAMFSGIKTNTGTLGFDNKIKRSNVESIEKATEVETIMLHAQQAGMSTGFVTTTRVTHATPASLYAHSANRDWECFSDLEHDGVDDTIVRDIAWQLLNRAPGNMTEVMMGGGWRSFLPDGENITRIDDYTNNYFGFKCHTDGNSDFTEDFKQTEGNVVVHDKSGLDKIDISKANRILGLFSPTHVVFDHERRSNSVEGLQDSPSLMDMTKKAIEKLQRNTEKGFFLMVEGGRIDHAHHDSWVNAALDETAIFDETIEMAYKMTDPKDTLIIVTADHGHTMAMSGYPARGADVRGYVELDQDPSENAEDGLPYSILSYANGEGFNEHVEVDENGNWTRKDLRNMNYTDFYFLSPSMIMRSYESHSGADVGIFASGPFAHFFHGVHEQTYIYYVMAYSACLNEFKDEPHCKDQESSAEDLLQSKKLLVLIAAILSLKLFN